MLELAGYSNCATIKSQIGLLFPILIHYFLNYYIFYSQTPEL